MKHLKEKNEELVTITRVSIVTERKEYNTIEGRVTASSGDYLCETEDGRYLVRRKDELV